DGEDLLRNTTHLTYSNTSSYSAANNLATLGSGNIDIRDEANSDSLDGINRDTTNTTYELWDVERQEGNIDLTVDHRLLSEQGREDIKRDVEDIREWGQDISRAASAVRQSEAMSITSFWNVLENNVIGTQIKNELQRDPKNHATLQ